MSLADRQQMALYIAIGEGRGGVWDYDLMTWADPPKPEAVFAIPAEMKGA